MQFYQTQDLITFSKERVQSVRLSPRRAGVVVLFDVLTNDPNYRGARDQQHRVDQVRPKEIPVVYQVGQRIYTR